MRKYDDELTVLVMIWYDNKDNNDENDNGGGGSGMIILIMREEAELIQATTLPHALHCAATFTTLPSHPIHCIAMCVITLHYTTLHCTVHSYITMCFIALRYIWCALQQSTAPCSLQSKLQCKSASCSEVSLGCRVQYVWKVIDSWHRVQCTMCANWWESHPGWRVPCFALLYFALLRPVSVCT